MTADPNWFYSTLAQSAATIVGLMAGILVTRLQGQLVSVRAARANLTEVVRAYHEAANEAFSNVKSFMSHGRSALEAMKSYWLKGQTTAPILARGLSMSGTVSGVELAAPCSYEAIEQLDSDLDAAGFMYGILEQAAVVDRMEMFRLLHDRMIGYSTSDSRNVAAIGKALRSRGDGVRICASRLEQTASVSSSKVVLWVLSLLCALGVIAPLAFLSAREAASKSFLLVAFGVGLFWLLVFLAWQVHEISVLGDARNLGPAIE